MKLKLSSSFRRYCVPREGRHPTKDRTRILDRLFEHRFRSIDRSQSTIRGVGWTDTEGLVPADPKRWEPFVGSILAVGLRIDERRIPAGALRVRRLESERAERFSVKSELAPARRRELREAIEQDLLGRCVPGTQVSLFLWNLETSEILLASTSESANASMRGLFRDTFECTPQVLTKVAIAQRVGREEWVQRIEAMAPAGYV